MAIDTLFRPQSGSASAGANDYVKDQFQDTTRPASNNSGFTSTALTNPLGVFVGNTDTPQYGVKTLWIKGLKQISDKTLWINSKPTYEVEFTEPMPAIKAYAYGNARILNVSSIPSVFLSDIDDAFGIIGNVRQVAWILQPSEQSGTVTPFLDNVSSSALTFGSSSSGSASAGLSAFDVLLQNSSAASNNLHDFRIEADTYYNTRIVGVMVYFENTAGVVNCRPGTSYVDKALVSTSAAAGATLPVVSGRVGAHSVISKLSSGAYQLSSVEPLTANTVGVGTNATNLVNVTTGHGASFPLGSLVGAIASGSSFYFGFVTAQSTDTLTVSPTLAFGLSGPLYKYGFAGPTFAIGTSFYASSAIIDPGELTRAVEPQSFGVTNGLLFYQDPYNKFRIWGSGVYLGAQDGLAGIGFVGATTGFLQIDGNFAALDFEHSSKGIFNATLSINGLPAYSVNAGASGVFRKTILADSGQGFNSVVIQPGTSLAVAANFLTKFTLYDLKNKGVTAGLLAEFPTFVDKLPRAAANATLMQLGSFQRYYADQLYLQGHWTRVTGATLAGGVAYNGASTNSALKFQYYGKDFAFIGTAGASMAALLDGASISIAHNVMKSVPTLGFHTVQLTYQAGATAVIHAVDIEGAQTGELKSLQKFDFSSAVSQVPKVYEQSETPFQAKNGDLWAKTPPTFNAQPKVFLKAFGLWLEIPSTSWTDDPNSDQFYAALGSSDGDVEAVNTAQVYNFASWSTAAANTAARNQGNSGGEAGYLGRAFYINGTNTASAVQSDGYAFNKVSWAQVLSGTNYGLLSSGGSFNGFLYINCGTTNGAAANATTTCAKYNNAAWVTSTAWSVARYAGACFVVGQNISYVMGIDTAGASQPTHTTKNAADVNASATASPVSNNLVSGARSGNNGVASTNTSAVVYVWNGSAWSAAITGANAQTQEPIAAFSASQNKTVFFGGVSGGPVGTVALFNGISAIAGVTNSNPRRKASGACI